MWQRRAALVLALLVVLATFGPTDAQTSKRAWRVGYLNPGSSTLAPLRLQPLRQGLRELGYVEGQNLTIEDRWAEGRFERLNVLAAELVQRKVDVIVTAAGPAARAAKDTTQTIPIVMVDPGDPVGTGLVASLARPGANVTGLSSATPELAAKHLQLLKEAMPGLNVVAFLWNGAAPAGMIALRETETAARLLGVRIMPLEIRDASSLDDAFGLAARERVPAMIIFTDPLTFTLRARIGTTAERARLVTISGGDEFIDAGTVMSYGPSFPDMFKRAAVFVDKIFKGARPAELPVEQPTNFQLVINARAAKALGVTIPGSLRQRADHVID